MTTELALTLLACWTLVAFGVGVVVGKMIAEADRQDLEHEDARSKAFHPAGSAIEPTLAPCGCVVFHRPGTVAYCPTHDSPAFT